eukprot:TRINITY_DN1330_c0_g1_i3.p1 TRINITY_DN1330_c0_g1~~TRINITY_DN1330_c0_g1_i3.p1  ORF type:complete len:391 (+),score=84.17 TRINITY_DN1330_c0_g1_i3:163-1335(+)
MIIDGSAYVRALGLEQLGFSFDRTGLPSDNPKERLTICVATTGDVQKLDIPRRSSIADLRAYFSRSLSIPAAQIHFVIVAQRDGMLTLPRVPRDSDTITDLYNIAESCVRIYDLNSLATFFINVMIHDAVSRIRVLPTESVATLRGYITERFPGEYDIDFFAAGLDEAATTLRAAGVTPEMLLHVQKKPERCRMPTRMIPTAAPAPIVAESDKAPAGFMRLCVKTLTGKSLHFFVRGSDTVAQLQVNIQGAEGIPLDQQRLIFAGKQLDDERLLSDYGVLDGATVHLVLKLRGGMLQETSGRDGFSAAAVRHVGVGCNHCGCLPIRGARYQCNQCNECDICELCEASGLHHDGHVLTKITDSRLLFKDLAQDAEMADGDDDEGEFNDEDY